MIPVIFRAVHCQGLSAGSEAEGAALRIARRETGAVLGIASGIGALGGYFIPRTLGASIKASGGPAAAIWCFVAFYVVCVAITWWHYARPETKERKSQRAALRPIAANAEVKWDRI